VAKMKKVEVSTNFAPMVIKTAAPVVFEGFDDRNLDRQVFAFHLLERGSLVHPVSDPQPGQHENERQEEGNPPAKTHEVRIGEHRTRDRGRERAKREAEQCAGLRDSAIESTLIPGGVFHGQQQAAAPFAPQRQTLNKSEQGQQNGSPDANRRVIGEEAHEHCRKAHERQGNDKSFLPADAVADMTKQNAADGPDQKCERE